MKIKICSALNFIKAILLLMMLIPYSSFSQTPFITVWKTDNPGGVSTDPRTIVVPSTGTFSYTWARVGSPAATGSGTGGPGAKTIIFPTAGTYRLSITPTGTVANQFKRFAFTGASTSTDCTKLIGVEQWGSVAWSSMEYAFSNAINLTSIVATDIPNLTNVTSMREMFSYNTSLSTVAGINNWDVSHVTNMQAMFLEANVFNSNISNWNVSNVTNMREMFRSAKAFNQPIGNWDVSKVTTMVRMFQTADIFNQDISTWNVSKVLDMSYMFNSALAFNQDISEWNVGMVANMSFMFQAARKFNQPISSWNVSAVTNMNSMFFNADVFNMELENWDVSKVTSMNAMFQSADLFDQDLGNWDIRSVTSVANMLNLTAMACSNYSTTLIGWAANPNTPNNLSLTNNTLFIGSLPITYGPDAVSARTTLDITKNWTITGDGYDENCVILLPIELLYFMVVQDNNNGLLQWVTASEQNNSGFVIQKSRDGISWEQIGFVPTKANFGNSSDQIEYQYFDMSLSSGVYYYRLKQIDFDGKYDYSKISILNIGNKNNSFQVYPNPAVDVLNINGLSINNQISVINTIGQEMMRLNTGDATNMVVDCSSWLNGFYIINITNILGDLTTYKIFKG